MHSTPSSRRHHFEGFTQRVAKIKIDPIRRTRRAIGAEGSHELEGDASYFRTALDEWKDINLSENFTEFAKAAYPVSESLAMVIHYEDKIMDLLVSHMEKGTTISLEPLLALLSHFAHDQDVRFEKYFQRAVATVTRIAARDPEPEVVEWCFSCLAWLFKYLSRLLVPDLRPVYDLMVPYLGKQRQKPFIIRFAAEAMSFLVRKAGSAYNRNKEPLSLIVDHMLRDYATAVSATPNELYSQGLMTLFTESIKGIQGTLHSGGNAVLECLTNFCFDPKHDTTFKSSTSRILKGSLVSVLHHTDVETFKPILDAILEMTDFAQGTEALDNLEAASMLLFTVSALRKGSRVGDWPSVIQRVAGLIKTVDKATSTANVATMTGVLHALAVVLHYAPMDAVISHITIFDTISRGKWRPVFLPFCNLFAELDSERFQGLLLNHFQRFIASNWQDNQASLCALIPALSAQGVFAKMPLQCPASWQKDMLSQLKKALDSSADRTDSNLLSLCNGELAVLRVTQGDGECRKQISVQLLRMVKEAAETKTTELDQWDSFALGQGFQFISDVSPESLQGKDSLSALCSSSSKTKGLLSYWQALNKVMQGSKLQDLDSELLQDFTTNVIECLSAPSHDLRLVALQLLETIYRQNRSEVPDLLTAAISIEDTPPSVQTARFISSQIRRLGMGYSAILSDDILSKAIPTYCFGLLHLQLSQAWEDSNQALKDMAQHEQAENVIFSITSTWLQGFADADETPETGAPELDKQIAHVSSDFECSNVLLIERACEITSAPFQAPQDALRRLFNQQHQQNSLSAESNRSQALRALNGMPQLAEKRSRNLVPVLLEWAGNETDLEDGMEDSTDNQRWGRKDQKAMLNVFAQFQNPRVLFKSEEVRVALLNLLSNGDADIQKSALKAMMAWKTPGVVKYQEHLFNFLDEARFREEVSVFLRLDQEGDAIRSEDCPQLMPVLLRLLYGRAVARAGSASGKRGQQTRRKAIFVALARFPDAVIQQFLEVALGSLSETELITDGSLNTRALDEFSFAQRRQVGLLNMLDDMLQTLGDRLDSFATKIADAVLLCLLKIAKTSTVTTDSEDDTSEDQQTSLDRAIRQAGFHCLNQVFASCVNVSWRNHVAVIMKELVKPRLEKLPVETAQSVSGILRLFSTWSSQLSMCTFLVDFYPETLQVVADCLAVSSAKNEVKAFVVESIIGRLLDVIEPRKKTDFEMTVDRSEAQEHARKRILEPNASLFVVKLGGLLRQSPPKDLLDASVLCVSRLAPLVSGAANIRDVVDVSVFLLGQPPRTVHHSTKRDLLQTLSHLIPSADLKADEEAFNNVYTTLCPLFAFFKDRESRTLLSEVVKQLSANDKELSEVAPLCDDLNSWAVGRLDEPDFERRSQAFNLINEDKFKVFSARQWQPLVYNMLYYIRDNEELAIRTNASYSLRRFVEAASSEGDFKDEKFNNLVSNGLWPGLQNGVREPSELVRVEFLYVTAHLVKHIPMWTAVNDMQSLLVDEDEEASFFNNILHIQQHRRLRALRRLADEAKAGVISSTNVSNFFIPMLEHFVFDPASDEGSYMLAAETIQSVGALTGCLDWSQYRNTLRRFIGYIKSKEELQKTVLRLVSAVIDALDNAAQAKTEQAADTSAEDMEIEKETKGVLKLTTTLPKPERLSIEINKQFLPPLKDFLHLKDESTVSLRVPVAVSVIKLIRVLPAEEHPVQLPSVLMDLCHILRSKAAEARDMCRKTLSKIMDILGASYFGYILKELRSALQRGYQLHVLSYTVHSILVENVDRLNAGDLDYCLPDLVAIIIDDIFGAVGQEKDAEEYISKMKEVKSSKSYDSMELAAKITTLPHLGQLILPIQTLLLEKLDLKTVKKIDELMRRIGLGITQNAAVKDRDVLTFCYEIVQQVYAANAASKRERPEIDYKIRKYLIQMKSASKNSNKGATTSYTFKLVRFALELVRTCVQRHEELKTPANLAGFLPIIGDAMVGGQEEVMMASVRLMTAIIKVPSPKIAENAPVYVSEAVKMLRAAPSTTTELAQAALKLVSAILRERPAVKIKETDMAYVLKRVKPDLEEPDRQGVIFNFLKAVLTRKVVIAEVYETMDTVAAIMVTNQTRTARDLARGIYFQFMMDYPQASARLSKQMGFLIKNLEFKYTEGRQSVLELLHLLLTKTSGDLVQELSSMLFVPLVMMMVNDDAPACREMAGALISKILERADSERMKNFINLIRTWLEQTEQPLLRRIALQCWTMYIGNEEVPAKDTSFLFKQLAGILVPSQHSTEDWELLYYSLQAFAKLCEVAPTTALSSKSKETWSNIFSCLAFPHAWVKLSAARLIGLLFADVGSASSKTEAGLSALPLQSSGGLDLTEKEMRQLCAASLRMMRFTNVTEQLVQQTARNLIFLGRCYGANNAIWVDDRLAVSSSAANGEEAANEDEEEEEDDVEEEEEEESKTALSFLFTRLSAIVRRDTGALSLPSLASKTASLQATAALCNALQVETLKPSLPTILLPLYVLTDASIPPPWTRDPTLSEKYKALVSLAQETMTLLQKKVGSGVYVNVMGEVQKTVRAKREERRRKRKVDVVAAPERFEKMKRRKQEGKKIKRKERGEEARGHRRGW